MKESTRFTFGILSMGAGLGLMALGIVIADLHLSVPLRILGGGGVTLAGVFVTFGLARSLLSAPEPKVSAPAELETGRE